MINPDWRTRVEGRLLPGGEGDLSSMWVPGKNGFLNIITVLSALSDILDTVEWEAAVEDVAWVIREARLQRVQHRCVAFSSFSGILI